MINTLLLFLFIFSILGLMEFIFKLLVSLFSNPPKPIELSTLNLIIYGAFISYVLTYLITI